jgi:hypothetical protein
MDKKKNGSKSRLPYVFAAACACRVHSPGCRFWIAKFASPVGRGAVVDQPTGSAGPRDGRLWDPRDDPPSAPWLPLNVGPGVALDINRARGRVLERAHCPSPSAPAPLLRRTYGEERASSAVWFREEEAKMPPGGFSVSAPSGVEFEAKITPIVVISCIMAATGGLMFGYDVGISGTSTSSITPLLLR